jgi:hypothetical protein
MEFCSRFLHHRLRDGRPLLALLNIALLPLAPVAIAQAAPRESAEIPGGVLEFQVILLTAPDAAIEAYINAFSERHWTIAMDSRGAFIGHAMGLELSATSRNALFDSRYWTPAPDGNGFVVTPPFSALSALAPAERRELYHELARWSDNKPELWPLVFADETIWHRLAAAGIPDDFLQRARSLCYPFQGGDALSDFSVLAQEFPDREILRRFLEVQSTVTTILPRLKLRTAKSISETLAYWTVNHHNPFAQPILEAMLEAATTDGVELISIMPSSIRLLSFDIEPEDVSHDLQLASYVISANIATPSPHTQNPDAFSDWFAVSFEPVPPPFRYGDVLALDHPQELVLNYACAYIGGDLVFARDPVGLGLWRFMRRSEIIRRNPHFSGGSFAGLRYQGSPPTVAGAQN